MTDPTTGWEEEHGETSPGVHGTAVLNEHYRYRLTRVWNRTPGQRLRMLRFVMLNPSTASALIDDPTIRRCISFAMRERFDGIEVVNLYGLRSTDPRGLRQVEDPVGPANDMFVAMAYERARKHGTPLVAAWGTKGDLTRVSDLLAVLRAQHDGEEPVLHCLGVTKDGHPKHPLYLPGGAPLVRWTGQRPTPS